jgi:ribosomal protein L11 methyltransferase
MKKYKEFLITAEPFNAELLSSILWELEITGINEDVNCIRVFAEPESNLDQDRINEQLNKLRREGLLRNFNVEESLLEERNWNEEWEQSLNIIQVSDKIVIKPSTKDYDKKKDEIVITIDPKMSFGTGEHQTTKLVIQLLEKYTLPGMKILDAGTGTGILSIAAVKLGAARVIGFDTDEWCYENAQENCKVNNVSEQVEIRIGDINIIPEKDFDLILANIQKNILLELSGEFSKKLDSKGIILLSGLLKDDERDIIKVYTSKGFRYLESRQMDEWIAMGLVKN